VFLLLILICFLNIIICGAGDDYCGKVFQSIANASNTVTAKIGDGVDGATCLIFDEDVFRSGPRNSADFDRFCGVSNYSDRYWAIVPARSTLCANKAPSSRHVQTRKPVFYTHELAEPDIIHFGLEYRLLSK
jgi:hypothetical protein